MNSVNAYLTLCKPRVVLLMMIKAMVGMAMSPVFSWQIFFIANIGIACAASAAATLNHLVDQHIDRIMLRTQNRPLVQGVVTPSRALLFATVLGLIGFGLLYFFVNTVTALLTFCSLLGYAVVYTLYLKHQTVQNIVIGGLAGAAPPLLGWVAMTNHIGPQAILLMLIVFVWTPPHFWSLAIYRKTEYAKANVPMMPVVFGDHYTKINIFLYTILLTAITYLPFAIGMSGWLYFICITVLNARFLAMTFRLFSKDIFYAYKIFKYSIVYLFVLFIVLLLDHFVI